MTKRIDIRKVRKEIDVLDQLLARNATEELLARRQHLQRQLFEHDQQEANRRKKSRSK